MSRFKRALRATVVESGFGYAAQVLSLFSLPLFLSTLGTEGYGLMVTVMALTGYLNFADAGLSWGSMILIAHAHGRQDRAMIAHITRHSAVLSAASGLIAMLALGGILGASALGWRLPMFAQHPEASPLILIAGLQLILTLQFGVFYNVFKGLQEVYWSAFYQGLGRLVGLAGMMMAAWLTRSVAVVMVVQLVVSTLGGIAASVHAWRRHRWAFSRGPWFDMAQYHAQVRIGGKNFLIQVGQTLGATAPTFGISSILGPAFVPFYTVPVTLLSLFFTPVNSWISSMQNAYGEAWASGAFDWTRSAFRQTVERMLVVGGLGVALFFSFGNAFIQLWTHGRLWLVPWMASSVSAIVVASTLVKTAEYLLIGLNRQRLAAVAEVASGLLAMILIPFCIRWLGLGAVGAGAIGAVLATSAWVLYREIGRRLGPGSFPSFDFILRAGVTLVATTAVGKIVADVGQTSDIGAAVWRLFLGGLSCSAIFVAAALGLRLVPMADALAAGRWLKRRLVGSPM
jgi:O-antigen/teichoic acid export membrane protein